jgi:hypothetical protein
VYSSSPAFSEHPELIDDYDYFWAFEDDLTLSHSSLIIAHQLLTRFNFQLAAPSLSYEAPLALNFW